MQPKTYIQCVRLFYQSPFVQIESQSSISCGVNFVTVTTNRLAYPTEEDKNCGFRFTKPVPKSPKLYVLLNRERSLNENDGFVIRYKAGMYATFKFLLRN